MAVRPGQDRVQEFVEEDVAHEPGRHPVAVEDRMDANRIGFGAVAAQQERPFRPAPAPPSPGEPRTATLVESFGEFLFEKRNRQFLELVDASHRAQQDPSRFGRAQLGKPGVDPGVEERTGAPRPPAGA